MRLSGERKLTIQQDGARCHTISTGTSYLNENVPDYIRKENWPPNSCDLNPLDYEIWDMMEEMVYKNISRYEDAAISDTWNRLTKKSSII